MLDKFKALFSKEKGRKNIINFIAILLLGVVLLTIGSYFNENQEKKQSFLEAPSNSNKIEDVPQQSNLIDNFANNLEVKLTSILSQINGVGEVDIMITLEDTAERIPAINTTKMEEITNEEDAQGGTRKVTREDETKQVVVSNNPGDQPLVIIKEVNPKVKGVIVVAEGAEDVIVKERLYSAVKTVLGIAGNRVEIYAKGK